MRGHCWGRTGLIGAVVLAAVLSIDLDRSLAAQDAAGPIPSFFNTKETRSSNLKPFTKWLSVLERYAKERSEAEATQCNPKHTIACNYAQWKAFLETLRGKDKMTQIVEVNARMNGAKYTTDPANWGESDYWSSPAEFMTKFGDCEDFAIVKYLSLRQLGFPERDLRIVAVEDLNLKVGHAILVVFLSGNSYVLDNQIKTVIETSKVRHYKPVFSINKDFWWRHS